MIGLLMTTIFASAADSLNPIAITQQFVLQGMVKKPEHIWYFILPTGIVNLIGGFLAYFGLISYMSNLFKITSEKYGHIIFTLELILGAAFIAGTCFLIFKQDNKEKPVRKIKSVSPPALIALGTGATISELTTALPYFAFLAGLFSFKPSFGAVTFVLILYNIIYMIPLIILYFVYVKAQGVFDRFYTAIKRQITKWSNIFAPAVSGAIGVLFIAHAILNLR